MQIKTKRKQHLTPVRMVTIKRTTNNKCQRGCGERHTVGGNVNWYRCNGKQHADFSKTKNRTGTSSSNSSPGYISRENKYINYLVKILVD